MNAQPSQEIRSTAPASKDRTASAELVATLTVLAFVIVAAAAVLLATPQSSQAVASPDSSFDAALVTQPAERPFHERYPVQPGGASIDPPTF